MAGYRKVEAEIVPAKHLVFIVKALTGKQVKEYFEAVPNHTTLKTIQEMDDHSYCFTFEEDALELKTKLKQVS